MGPAQRKENRHQPLRFGNGHLDSPCTKKIWTRCHQRRRHRSAPHATKPRTGPMSRGAIYATIISPHLDIAAKKQCYPILVNIADLKIPYPQQVIETTDRFIKENPDTAKNFLRGFIEGVRYATTQKEETKKVITKYLKTADPEILEATYQS